MDDKVTKARNESENSQDDQAKAGTTGLDSIRAVMPGADDVLGADKASKNSVIYAPRA